LRRWKLVLVLAVALAISGYAGLGNAARAPTDDEKSQISERAIAWMICCVDAENGAVYDVKISTASPRFARANIRVVYPGIKVVNAVAVMRKGPAGWKVLDAGTHAIGCRDMPQKARVDLGLAGRGICLRTGG
jgi:hypothetical protein